VEGLAAGLAKQKFAEAIESLKNRDGRSAWDGMNYALSGGLADAACGLMLLKIFAARKDQYDGIIREIEGSIKRMAEMPTTLEISAYGYYLLGRCYAFVGIKKEKFRLNLLRMTLKMRFSNEYMDKAASLYLQSIAKDSSFAEAFFELALVYDIGLNAREKAIDAYKIFTELNPDHVMARGNLISLYNETKQLDKAEAEAEQLSRLNPNITSFGTLSDIYGLYNNRKDAWLAAKAGRELPEQHGIRTAFSSHTQLLSPETVASVPEPRQAQTPVVQQQTSRAHFAH
jgi:tetratricopeptide (TPR) repeat protein